MNFNDTFCLIVAVILTLPVAICILVGEAIHIISKKMR